MTPGSIPTTATPPARSTVPVSSPSAVPCPGRTSTTPSWTGSGATSRSRCAANGWPIRVSPTGGHGRGRPDQPRHGRQGDREPVRHPGHRRPDALRRGSGLREGDQPPQIPSNHEQTPVARTDAHLAMDRIHVPGARPAGRQGPHRVVDRRDRRREWWFLARAPGVHRRRDRPRSLVPGLRSRDRPGDGWPRPRGGRARRAAGPTPRSTSAATAWGPTAWCSSAAPSARSRHP